MNPLANMKWDTTPSPAMATTQALQAGADPADLARAKQELGKTEYIGYCESFTEAVTGEGNKGASASEAWQNQQDRAVADPTLQGVQPGDAVYFSDPSNSDGHVGVYSGNGNFISATEQDPNETDATGKALGNVRDQGIADWQNSTGQSVLGYVPMNRETQQTAQSSNPLANMKWGSN